MTLRIEHDDLRAGYLAKAIREGDVPWLRTQLEQDPDLARARVVDEKGVGRTLLHLVADWPGHFPNAAEVVRLFADAGAELDAALWHTPTAGAPETPLHWAASSDDVVLLDALLDAGANLEAPGAIFTNGTAMSDAVVFAQWNAAARLVERGAKTTLWQAAALGLVERVRAGLAEDPSADEVTNALWHACRGGQLETVKLLTERGGDLLWPGHDGKTPVDVAREAGDEAVIEWIAARTDTARSVAAGVGSPA